MTTMIVGLTGSLVGGIVFGVGYSNFSALDSNSAKDDWSLYRDMMNTGFWTMVTSGSVGVAFSIPFGVSYGIKPKNKKVASSKIKADSIAFNLSEDTLGVGLSFKL